MPVAVPDGFTVDPVKKYPGYTDDLEDYTTAMIPLTVEHVDDNNWHIPDRRCAEDPGLHNILRWVS